MRLVGWACQPNEAKERTGGQRERAESGVRDARNSFSASRARKAEIIIRPERSLGERIEEMKKRIVSMYAGGGGER